MVSGNDVSFFKNNGYLIVRDFLSSEEIRDLQSWAQDVHDYKPTETSDFMPYEVYKSLSLVLQQHDKLTFYRK